MSHYVFEKSLVWKIGGSFSQKSSSEVQIRKKSIKMLFLSISYGLNLRQSSYVLNKNE
jgi:hypothetical protein